MQRGKSGQTIRDDGDALGIKAILRNTTGRPMQYQPSKDRARDSSGIHGSQPIHRGRGRLDRAPSRRRRRQRVAQCGSSCARPNRRVSAFTAGGYRWTWESRMSIASEREKPGRKIHALPVAAQPANLQGLARHGAKPDPKNHVLKPLLQAQRARHHRRPRTPGRPDHVRRDGLHPGGESEYPSKTGMDLGALISCRPNRSGRHDHHGADDQLPDRARAGMGINAFFTFTICLRTRFPWQEALGMVFVNGVVFLRAFRHRRTGKIVIGHPLRAEDRDHLRDRHLFIGFIGLKKTAESSSRTKPPMSLTVTHLATRGAVSRRHRG